MTDKLDGNGRRRIAWIVYLILCLSLYVLSFGPATWKTGTDPTAVARCRVIYWPIIWLGEHNPQAAQVLLWYIDLCRPRK
jgi:hypothetical protein